MRSHPKPFAKESTKPDIAELKEVLDVWIGWHCSDWAVIVQREKKTSTQNLCDHDYRDTQAKPAEKHRHDSPLASRCLSLP
jgi:hypothetical protein